MIDHSAAIAAYLAGPLGADVTEAEREELATSAPWIPGDSPLTAQQFAELLQFIRLRMKEPYGDHLA